MCLSTSPVTVRSDRFGRDSMLRTFGYWSRPGGKVVEHRSAVHKGAGVGSRCLENSAECFADRSTDREQQSVGADCDEVGKSFNREFQVVLDGVDACDSATVCVKVDLTIRAVKPRCMRRQFVEQAVEVGDANLKTELGGSDGTAGGVVVRCCLCGGAGGELHAHCGFSLFRGRRCCRPCRP